MTSNLVPVKVGIEVLSAKSTSKRVTQVGQELIAFSDGSQVSRSVWDDGLYTIEPAKARRDRERRAKRRDRR